MHQLFALIKSFIKMPAGLNIVFAKLCVYYTTLPDRTFDGCKITKTTAAAAIPKEHFIIFSSSSSSLT
jgi:hypothetical protein